MNDLMALRMQHGEGTAAWATTVEVGDDRWLALTGAPHADFNLALAGSDETVAPLRDRLLAGRVPAQLALVPGVDPAPLIDAGWRRVGDAPFMQHPAEDVGEVAGVCRMLPDEVSEAEALVADVFGLDPAIAAVAVRRDADCLGAWDRGRLCAAVVVRQADDAVVGWSFATDPERRREGFGRTLMRAWIGRAHELGAERILLHASAAGEPFYRAMGCETLERWDFWSRPRWILPA